MKKVSLVQLFNLVIRIAIVFKSFQLLVRLYNIIILNLVLRGNDTYRSKLHFIVEELKIENVVGYVLVILLLVLP